MFLTGSQVAIAIWPLGVSLVHCHHILRKIPLVVTIATVDSAHNNTQTHIPLQVLRSIKFGGMYISTRKLLKQQATGRFCLGTHLCANDKWFPYP